MVTTLEIKEEIQAHPITLEELGEMVGVPIKVRPWWGSVRRRSVAQKVHLTWECPADGQTRKKRPEVQNGSIILWEGKCGYNWGGRGSNDRHTHAQTIKVKSVAHQAMLVSIWVSEGVPAQFLLGVDGGTPFVTQVTRRPQTVAEALEWLKPKKVKEAIAQGLDVKRQGDWFFIPTPKEPRRHKNGINVPRSTPALKTNALYRGAALVYNCAQTRHHAGLVIYQSVLGLPCVAPFVKGNVKAPDHKPLFLQTWHLGVRNRSHPWRNAHLQRRQFDD